MENNVNNSNTESSKDEFVKVDLRDGTKNSKDFFSSFFNNPLNLLKKISKSKDNKFFNVSILILLIWIIITLIHSLFGYNYNYDGISYALSVIRDITIPILSVGFLTLIIYFMNPNKDDNYRLTNTVTAVITCKIPIILSSFISLLNLVTTKASFIINPIVYFCIATSTIFIFFAIKYLYKENEDCRCFKSFLIIESIFYIIYLFLSFLNIYLV